MTAEESAVPPFTAIDPQVLADLESKYRDTACPVHGDRPVFELGEGGALIERFCCEALLQIVRELQAAEEAQKVPAAPQ